MGLHAMVGGVEARRQLSFSGSTMTRRQVQVPVPRQCPAASFQPPAVIGFPRKGCQLATPLLSSGRNVQRSVDGVGVRCSCSGGSLSV